MSPGTQIFLSGTLTFGVPLALAVRDLIALRRPYGGGWPPEPQDPTPPAPMGGGSPERPALPLCLIEAGSGRLVFVPERELEPV